MTADPPSFVADAATQVVAWHNRHPLARRIARKDVQSVGIVTLPFARDGQRPWDAPQPKRGLLALMFPPRQRRRLWPVFSEDLLPEFGLKRLAKFALRHGFTERPGPADLPERVASFDRDLLAVEGAEFPPERLNRYLVTAAIDLGPNRPRLLLGPGQRPAVLGQRLWSLPRLAALGGVVLVALVVGVAGLWLKAMPQRGANPALATPASAASAPVAAAASVARPAAAAVPVVPPSAPAPPMLAPTPDRASAPAPNRASAPASALVSAPASAALPPAALPIPAAAGPAAAAAKPAAMPSAPARAQSAAADMPTTSASNVPPVPQEVEAQQASAPLVPRLRPDLAASARAELAPRGTAPTPPATPPRAGTSARPGLGATTPASAPRFYALVSRPVRNKAEAESMLRRLRAETDRIAHPTATQTALQESRDGWRVTWWPFTNPRQAENARVALARRIELEVVDF